MADLSWQVFPGWHPLRAAARMGIRRPLARRGEVAMADESIIPAEETACVVARLKHRMIEDAIPLWSTVGWDNASGGFIDRLHRDGTPDTAAPRRVFVQARQISCYAKA